MFTRKTLTLIAVSVGFSLLSAGCAPKKNETTKNRGRISRGTPSMRNGVPTNQYSTATWGTVSGVDQSFQYAVGMLAQPSLDGSGEQLGQVQPNPTQGQGVYFWGDNLPSYNAGAITNGRLHIEIYDDLAGQIGANGQPIDPLVIHIGPDQEGFQSVSGQAFNGQIFITFSSAYNVITLQGYVQGQEFVGTMSFSNGYTANMTLGQFRVPACGFFRCQ